MADKKKKKWYKVLLIVLGSIFGFILVFLAGVNIYFHAPVAHFYSISDYTFKLPGANEGFVHQGIAYDKTSNSFFVTGYFSNKSNSPIYIVNKDTGDTKKVLLNNQDGSVFNSHAGGIAVNGNYVYVTNGCSLEVFNYTDAINAKQGDKINSVGNFKTVFDGKDDVACSFVTIHGNEITIGEFYKDPQYPSAASHKFTTANGQYNQALGVTYALDSTKDFGINPDAIKAYSLPDMAQGMVFDDKYMYVSTSWGVGFSHIYKHDVSKMDVISQITLNGKTVDLYAVENSNLVTDLKAAPMSEELEIVDGKMYIMCESASNKYIFGKLTFSWWCMATDISKI